MGEAGGSSGEGGSAPVAGAAGAAEGGVGGEGGIGGEGGALACFSGSNWLGGAGAPDGIFAEPKRTGGVHVGVSCAALQEHFTVSYDVLGNEIGLDLAAVAPVRRATYTLDYSYFGGEVFETGCKDGAAERVGSKLTIPVGEISAPQQFRLTALHLEDECGSDLTLENQGNENTCFNLTVHSVEGGWSVDCYEGSCYPSCAPPPGN